MKSSYIFSLCFRLIFGAVFYTLFLPTAFVAAQSTPEEFANVFIAKMKGPDGAKSILSLVDWETMYQSMSKQELKRISVSSPSELQEYFARSYADPGEYIRRRYENALKRDPNFKSDMDEKALGERIESARRQFAEQQAEIRKTEYSIQKVELSEDGESATVTIRGFWQHPLDLEGLYKKEQTHVLPLKKKGGTWVLTSLKTLQPNKGSAEGAEFARPH